MAGRATKKAGWTGSERREGRPGALPKGADADDDEATDQMDIQFHGPDVISLVHNDIPYTLSLRRVK